MRRGTEVESIPLHIGGEIRDGAEDFLKLMTEIGAFRFTFNGAKKRNVSLQKLHNGSRIDQ